MPVSMTISIDAMGGDEGPAMVIPGLDILLQRQPDVRFLLFGEQDKIESALVDYKRVAEASTIIHCEVTIAMDEKPSQALRSGRYKSSMWKAIEAVKGGDADFCISAGNTGALMVMSKFCLRTMANIERPAIAAIWPNLKGESIVLDMGATIGADAQQLVDFAMMGGAMARALFDLDKPTIGLLNIGVEEVKGLEEIRTAGRILREMPDSNFEYYGFVEGNDLGQGTVDVVVTEGFTGNIALKTAEGTAKQIAGYLRDAMTRTWRARLGYLLAQGAFRRLRHKMDPRRVNGGVFLGLNGIVIKSHGGTDPTGFASATELGFNIVNNGLLEKISSSMTAERSSSKEDED